MILNGKQLLELEEARDKFTIDFAKWLIKNYKKAPQFKTVKKYVLRKQNKVVADEKLSTIKWTSRTIGGAIVAFFLWFFTNKHN